MIRQDLSAILQHWYSPWARRGHAGRTPVYFGSYHGLGCVVSDTEPNPPGPAYGKIALRLRVSAERIDFALGQKEHVVVSPGQCVKFGALLGFSGREGNPMVKDQNLGEVVAMTTDLQHLHIEARPAGESHNFAVDPTPWLHLKTVGHYAINQDLYSIF